MFPLRPSKLNFYAIQTTLVIVGFWTTLITHQWPPGVSGQQYDDSAAYLKSLSKNISAILDSFSKNYDRRVRPNYGGEPVVVGVSMYVLSVSSVSEIQMEFTTDFYFRQKWKDPRLQFQGPKRVRTLSVSSEFLSKIWVPDTFFVNEKQSHFHHATTRNEFLRISQEGDIMRSIRITVTASCAMQLRYFPMDSQLCNIEIESFGYTMSDIRYVWADGAKSVGVSNEVSLPQFKVNGYKQRANEISLSTGNYSRLACDIQFVRSMGYYLIQIYIPSSLIVVISWVSFWLNRNAAPARVSLGIITVLTMTTQMSQTNQALPKLSYIKSIDVFLGTCFVMVFAALLEYATVGYLAKHIQMRKNDLAELQKMALRLQNEQRALKEREEEEYGQRGRSYSRGSVAGGATYRRNTLQQSIEDRPAPLPSTSSTAIANAACAAALSGARPGMTQLLPFNPNQICGITPSDIDKYSRILFPVSFTCFQLLYWIIYLNISNIVIPDLTLLEVKET